MEVKFAQKVKHSNKIKNERYALTYKMYKYHDCSVIDCRHFILCYWLWDWNQWIYNSFPEGCPKFIVNIIVSGSSQLLRQVFGIR